MCTPRTGDFCSVILASGMGSRMLPITEAYPKCLLNIGNFPLIYYTLHALEQSGFEETLIVVREPWLDKIKASIEVLNLQIRVDYHLVSRNLEPNTATILVSMRHKLKSDDVFVLNGDVYGDLNLRALAATYRKRDATLCAYIQPPMSEDPVEKAARPRLYRSDSLTANYPLDPSLSADYVAYNPDDQRLLICVNESNVDDGLSVTRELTTEYPKFRLHKTYRDLHIYIIRKSLLEMISSQSVLNFQSDVLSFLLERQFTAKNRPEPPSDIQEEFDDLFSLDDNDGISQQYPQSISGDAKQRPIRCYAYVAPVGTRAFRINSLSSLFAANVMALKTVGGKSSAKKALDVVNMVETRDYLLGMGSENYSTYAFKNSIVGLFCHIGPKCKITNSIVMNNVRLGEGCVVTNSIIGNDVTVEKKSKLVECLVGTGQVIPIQSSLSRQTISNSRQNETVRI